MTTSTFPTMGVPTAIVERLDAGGITSPFPIQSAVIPDAVAGRDVIGRAPTGAGKTLAFGIPLVARLAPGRRRRPTGLVLAPTRELAEQITRELAPLASALGHRAVALYGGVGYGQQRRALDDGAELVVACPGRLEDLLATGALRLDDVTFVVIDEADRMADMGFLPAVKRIVEQAASDRQTLLFSATLDGAVGRLSGDVQRDPVRHEIGPTGSDVTSAHHVFWCVDAAERVDRTCEVATRLGSIMVFCRTRRGVDRVAKQLARADVPAAAIHGGLSQAQRDRALRDFSTGRVRALVATDVAGRGVHVDDVAAVVHFDPPEDAATYIHRSGRTARAGATGVVVSLWSPAAHRTARQLQRSVGLDVVVAEPDLEALTTPTSATAMRSSPAELQAHPTTVQSHPTSGHTSRKARSRPTKTHDRPGETGTLIAFHPRRGFGFIDNGGDRDVFVHHSNLATQVRRGQRVKFELRQGRRGLEAVEVYPI